MSEVAPYLRNPIEWTSPTGIKTTLHPIGALATSLGRQPTTIRAWEVAGIIPRTPFTDKRKRRMYAQEHINLLVELAEKHRIRTGSRIADTAFVNEVFKGFEEINTKFFGEQSEK